jgi:hypothetical protein
LVQQHRSSFLSAPTSTVTMIADTNRVIAGVPVRERAEQRVSGSVASCDVSSF